MNNKEKKLFWKDTFHHLSSESRSNEKTDILLKVCAQSKIDSLILFLLKLIGLTPSISPSIIINSSYGSELIKELTNSENVKIEKTNQKLSSIEKLINFYFYLYLAKPELIEFIKFGMVGVSGMAVDLLLVTFFKEFFSYDVRFCSILAFPFAVTSNYILNCLWTFKGNQTINIISYVKFFFTNIIGLLVRVWSIHLILMVIPRIGQKYYIGVTMLGILVAFFVNFITSKFLVFQKSKS